ncbi:MAG TPA: autotransporter domain-containing protein, partial [Pseudolabrys sp.]|nr:autotransporter domain-containing protein [Pseudolabrys sp.]
MNPVDSKTRARRLATALMMSAAPFIAAGHAHAQTAGTCTPATSTGSPANGQTIRCTGGTITANDPNGYGTGTESNNQITVESTATVTGTSRGFHLGDNNTINNNGTVEATGVNGLAIFAPGANSDLTITNFNIIRAGAAFGNAISVGRTVTIDNAASSSLISGGDVGIRGGTVKVTQNAGTIEATGGAGTAILAGTAEILNSKTIQALGGTAVSVVTTKATVENLSGGTIAGLTNGIDIIDIISTLANTIDITNHSGATIKGATAIRGSGRVRNAGLIQGGTASVEFTGGAGATNELILQTGSQMTGVATGSTLGAINNLVFEGHGTASNNFLNFNSLEVNADTSWVLSGNAGVAVTTVKTGSLAVDGMLSGTVGVNSGARLAGHGTITGPLAVTGTVEPGAIVPFSTLTVNGSVNFQTGSIYQVNVNAAGQTDLLRVIGIGSTVTLTGGRVNVLAQGGTYAPSTPYTILTAPGGLGGTNTFQSVDSNLVFLTPTLNYDDPTKVVLTMTLNGNPGNGGGGTGGGTGGGGTGGGTGGGGAGGGGTGGGGTVTTPPFAAIAQTRNQNAVATSLAGGSLTNPLVLRILNETLEGARAAFDALSGEIFGSVHTAQGQEASFTRSGILGRLRQAFYAEAPGALGALGFAGPELSYADGGASSAAAHAAARAAGAGNANDAYAADMGARMPMAVKGGNSHASRDLTFWAQGLGGWGHADSDGNAASLKSRFAGFLSGADMRFGDVWRAGLVAGYTRTNLDADARLSSAGIDSVTVGLYAGGKLGAFNLRSGASFSYDS